MLRSRKDTHQDSFLYKLLIDRGACYRAGRHFLLILAGVVISINQVYMGFAGYYEILGDCMPFFVFFILATYLLMAYLNIYLLVPRLLLKEKYAAYFGLFFLLILVLLFIHYGVEYAVFNYFDLSPGVFSFFGHKINPFWLEFTATFLINSITILGVGFTVLLKYWFINDMKANELETVHVRSEVEKLKEQVSPSLLFSILHRVSDMAETDPAKASDMIMELSQILRYELYDCNRPDVLLNSEINFIRNYLRLEQSACGKMEVDLTIEGETNGVLIPPLLFLPIVQYAVRQEQEKKDFIRIMVRLCSSNDSISFSCSCSTWESDNSGLANIRLRLEKLYNDRYSLQHTEGDKPMLQLKINY